MNMKNILLLVMFMFLLTTIHAQDYDVINIEATTYNYTPAPINPGDVVEIWVQMTNNSNIEAKNIEYFLETEYPFSFLEQETYSGKINSIAPFQTKMIKYKLKTEYNTIAGTYEISLKYKHEGIEAYSIQKYNLDIASQKAIVDIIETVVEPVKIGSKSNIKFTIKNLSGRDARDVFVTLGDSENEDIRILDVKTKYLETLNANQTSDVQFSVIVDKYAENKTYSLPIDISYKDYEGEYVVERQVGFEVIDDPDLLLTVQKLGQNFNLRANTTESIDLEIYNVGNVDAEAVYIEITSQAIERDVRYFLGNIEKDNYDNVELKFDTKDVSGKQKVHIKVTYKNSNLDQETFVKTIEVDVLPATKATGGVMLVITSIFSIIGLVIGIGLLIIILKWLFKIIVKPAYKDLFKIFKK